MLGSVWEKSEMCFKYFTNLGKLGSKEHNELKTSISFLFKCKIKIFKAERTYQIYHKIWTKCKNFEPTPFLFHFSSIQDLLLWSRPHELMRLFLMSRLVIQRSNQIKQMTIRLLNFHNLSPWKDNVGTESCGFEH